jgi:hypothetical protein
VQEDSTLNTSSEMRKRKSWKHLDQNKPMTDGQKKYATDLMIKTGDYTYEEAWEELNSYGDISQSEGHQLLRERFVSFKIVNEA